MGEGGEALAGVGRPGAERTELRALTRPKVSSGSRERALCAGEWFTVGSWGRKVPTCSIRHFPRCTCSHCHGIQAIQVRSLTMDLGRDKCDWPLWGRS